MQTRVRAVIIDNHEILLIRRVKEGRIYWVFPGGGVEEHDNSPQSALVRECKEELGVDVDVGELFAEQPFNVPGKEQVEMFFQCKIVGGTLGTGTGPEFSRDPSTSGAYQVEWVPTDSLASKSVFPEEVRDKVVTTF